MRDHRSIERQLTTGKLPVKPMGSLELLRVVATAEEFIKREILYAEDTKEELIRLVAGQPYLLHLIGRESLLNAFRAKKKIITVGPRTAFPRRSGTRVCATPFLYE